MNVFRPEAPGTAAVLGPLESAVLNALWDIGEGAAVGQVVERLERTGYRVHYSSAKTTLNTLVVKGLAKKRLMGKANTFTVTVGREEFQRRVVDGVLGGLMRNYRNPLLAHMAEHLAQDDASLEEFERLLDEQRHGRPR